MHISTVKNNFPLSPLRHIAKKKKDTILQHKHSEEFLKLSGNDLAVKDGQFLDHLLDEEKCHTMTDDVLKQCSKVTTQKDRN